MSDLPPGPGHNLPDNGVPDHLDPELIAEQLEIDYRRHSLRRDELMSGIARFVMAAAGLRQVDEPRDLEALDLDPRYAFVGPALQLWGCSVDRQGTRTWSAVTDLNILRSVIVMAEVRDDQTAQRLTSFVKQIKDAYDAMEGDRDREKRPYDAVAKRIQGFFAQGLQAPLDISRRALEQVLHVYQIWKVAEERRLREEAAAKAKAEAKALMAEAIKTEAPEIIDAAVAQGHIAETTQRMAAAPRADLARTRGSYGGVASLRQNWDFEVEDFAAVDDKYKVIDRQALLRDIRAAKGQGTWRGIKVFDASKTSVRR